MSGPQPQRNDRSDRERFVERDVDGLEIDRSGEEGEPFDLDPEEDEDDADL